MARKKYVDKIVSCSICGTDYTEILCEKDLPDIVAFYCKECFDKMKKEYEKADAERKTTRKRSKKIKQPSEKIRSIP